MNRLDIILFGASGFTGKYCIGEIYRLTKVKGLTWGIAGRSEEKLRNALIQYQKQIGKDLGYIPVIIADINNKQSLIKMTASARIIINCCGPFYLFGESVVKACIETGTHQVDVSGEPHHMEIIQYKYHKLAQEKGVYIISSCGCDSIPADLGVLFLQEKFRGTLNSVEVYMKVDEEEPKEVGPLLNTATWNSLVHSLAHANKLSTLRKKMYKTKQQTFLPKLKPRPLCHKSDVINSWVVPFLGADRSVLTRTQHFLYQHENIRPAQIQTYEAIKSPISIILMGFYFNIISYLVKYEFGKNLLLKHPELFSAGMFSNNAPSEQKLQKQHISFVFKGDGWSEEIPITQIEHETRPNNTIIGCVSGINPAYGITSTAVTLAAITVLTESDKLPNRGGVYSPGAAFYKTSLMQQLHKNGLFFEIKSKL